MKTTRNGSSRTREHIVNRTQQGTVKRILLWKNKERIKQRLRDKKKTRNRNKTDHVAFWSQGLRVWQSVRWLEWHEPSSLCPCCGRNYINGCHVKKKNKKCIMNHLLRHVTHPPFLTTGSACINIEKTNSFLFATKNLYLSQQVDQTWQVTSGVVFFLGKTQTLHFIEKLERTIQATIMNVKQHPEKGREKLFSVKFTWLINIIFGLKQCERRDEGSVLWL